jgi:hypothetical protein
MLLVYSHLICLFAQRPPPDWQNSFWSSPLGLLAILVIMFVGGLLSRKK